MFAYRVGKKEVTVDSDMRISYAQSYDRVDHQCWRYQNFHVVYRRKHFVPPFVFPLYLSLHFPNTRVRERRMLRRK